MLMRDGLHLTVNKQPAGLLAVSIKKLGWSSPNSKQTA